VTYTPDTDFNGTDTFIYELCDNASPANCATAAVNITIIPTLDAVDDTETTSEDTPVVVDILTNDGDVDTNTATVSITDIPDNGTVTVNADGTVEYTPNADYNGTDTFIYEVCDNAIPANCDSAIVTITVIAQVVEVENDSFTVTPDEEIVIDVLDNDTSTGTITITEIDGMPISEGDSVTLDDGTVVTLNEDGTLGIELGDDSSSPVEFEYTVVDSNGDTETAEVTLVFEAQELPDVTDDGVFENQYGETMELDIFANDDFAPTNGTLTIEQPENGTVEVADPNNTPNNPSDDVITYTPNVGYEGDDSFVYTVCNSQGCASATVELTIIDPCLLVFNEFSPNGDGANDTLRINCIDSFPNNTVEIFNRWGNTVFKATNYNNDTNYFDGTSNGRAVLSVPDKLPVGTYFYVIDLGDGSPIMKGWIYINR